MNEFENQISAKATVNHLHVTKAEFKEWFKEALKEWLSEKLDEARNSVGRWTIKTALAALIAAVAYLIVVFKNWHGPSS